MEVATNQKVNKTVKTLTYYLSFCSLYFHSLPTINGRLEKTLFFHQFDKFYKEGGKLTLTPRKTPLSLIYLRNLTTLAEAGARIVPAIPACYHNPQTIEDLVDFVVARALDQFGLNCVLIKRWVGHG